MKVRIIPYLSVTLQRYGYFGRWWDRTTWPRIWTLYPAPGHAFCLPDHHRSLTKESVLISGYQDPRAHSLLTTDKPSCFYGTQRAMIHFYQSCRETLTHLGDWVSCPMNAVTIWTGKLPLAQSLPSLCPPSFSLLAGHLLPSPPPKNHLFAAKPSQEFFLSHWRRTLFFPAGTEITGSKFQSCDSLKGGWWVASFYLGFGEYVQKWELCPQCKGGQVRLEHRPVSVRRVTCSSQSRDVDVITKQEEPRTRVRAMRVLWGPVCTAQGLGITSLV